MIIRGYRKEYRRLFFAILFQMGIIRLSVSLFDFEDRAQSMETLELVVFIITKSIHLQLAISISS